MEIENSTCYSFFWVLVLVFQAGGCGNQRNWECAFFLLVRSDLSSWLGVAFVLAVSRL